MAKLVLEWSSGGLSWRQAGQSKKGPSGSYMVAPEEGPSGAPAVPSPPPDSRGIQHRLLGENVVLDYQRDSPVFRQQVEGFNDSLKGLKEYYRRLVSAAEAYVDAGRHMADLGDQLAAELCNREFSRSLFTNAHNEELGPLSEHLQALESTLRKVQSAQRAMLSRFGAGVGVLKSFAEGDLKDTDSMTKEVWRLGDAHEGLLLRTLESVEAAKGGSRSAQNLHVTRTRFELARFDMVQYFNQIDGRKKLRLVAAVDRLGEALGDFFRDGHCQIMGPQEDVRRARKQALALAEENFALDTTQWRAVRSRLEAELQGALPPPGAPVGAFSPVYPRQESATTPPYLATLTTEVLGRNSKQASFKDLSHARDEGVLKQGYLISAATFGVREATVSLAAGRAPFSFVVEQPQGSRVELQAENEDDMVKWITAIRRCRRRFHRRSSSSTSSSDSSSSGSADSTMHPLMAELRAANTTCCECDDPEVVWSAYNIGCVLCEQCATIHRQLGLATSKLRSLELDDWPTGLLECFVHSLGNVAVNSVWEVSVMNGWTRPGPKSALEIKTAWIVSKYQWYAFVEEDRADRETNSRRLYDAAAQGDTRQAMWCLAHKGSPAWADPQNGFRTALHACTLGGHKDCTLFLLINGGHAAVRMPDESKTTPYDIARAKRDTEILQLFLETERGDYL